MIKNKKLPENILDFLPQVVDFLKTRQKVVFAYLFGSLARDKVLPLSDIDVAIYLKEGVDLNKEKMSILQNLIDLLGTEEIDRKSVV